jgi:hypothetical protein
MFTPPGLKGRQFRITGNSFPRLRRPHQRRRHILLAIAGVLTLSVLSWGTVQLVGIFGGDRKATAAATCVLRQGEAASGSGDGLALVAGPAPRASGSASAHARTVAGASPAATAAAAAALPGAGITVNVFNATDQSGLAGRTAALLKQRGFTIGRIGNAPAPLQNKVTGPAQVTGGRAGAKAMAVLSSEVTGAKPVTDVRKDASVDLVIGNGFTALATPAQAAQALAVASKPQPVASPHC